MRDYDGRQSPDFMGRKEGKGAKGGSLLGEFFPDEVKAISMKRPSEIGKIPYPDSANAIYDEQEGDVRMADRGSLKSMRRK